MPKLKDTRTGQLHPARVKRPVEARIRTYHTFTAAMRTLAQALQQERTQPPPPPEQPG